MISYAKRDGLYDGGKFTEAQIKNKMINIQEIGENARVLESLPRRIIFELTNACNLQCKMCGREAREFRPRYLEMDIIKWFEPIFDVVEEVTLMGWGEPTLHPHFVEVLSILNKYSCRKYVCTNGMLIERYATEIVDNRVDMLAISVNGASENTNDSIRAGSNLNKIIQGIQLLKKKETSHKMLISFVFCAMKSNIHELPQLIEMANELGIKRVKVVHLTAFSEAMLGEIMWNMQDVLRKEFLLAIEKANRYGIELELPYIQGEDPAGEEKHGKCIAPWRDMFIGSDAILRPCMSTSQEIGKLDLSESFDSHWNSEHYVWLRENVNADGMPKQCARCYQASFCNWNKKESYNQVKEDFAHDWK